MPAMRHRLRVAFACGTVVVGCLLAERSWAQAVPAPAKNPPANAGNPTVPPTDPFGNPLSGPNVPAPVPAPTKPADVQPTNPPASKTEQPRPRLFVPSDTGAPATKPAEKPPATDPAAKPRPNVKPDPFGDEPLPAKPNEPRDTKPNGADDTKPKTETPAPTIPKNPITQPLDTRMPEVEQLPGQLEFKAGQDLLQAGKYSAAIEQFKKSLKVAPDEAATHFSLGVCYRMLQQLDDAINEFSEAIRLDPELGDAYLRRGICWYYKGEYGMAIIDCDDAAAISLNDPRPFTWKGMALVKQGKLIDAVNTYSLALRNDSRFGLAHVNRGLTYFALKDYARAIDDFEGAILLAPRDGTLYFKRGVAQTASGDWLAAVKSYTEAIRLDPQYADAYQYRSAAYEKLGDAKSAQADEQQARQLKLAGDHGHELPAPK